MSLPKKGSRTIVTEAGSFRWLIRKKSTYSQANAWGTMTVAIESLEEQGRGVLLVDTKIFRPENRGVSNQTAITPGTVRKMILGAIEDGWDPYANETYNFTFELIPNDEN